MDAHAVNQLDVLISAKWLGHDVCHHLLRWNILEGNDTCYDLLANEVMANVDVLAASMMFGILAERDASLTVGVDGGGRVRLYPELMKEFAPPHGLSGCLSGCHVLCLYGGQSDGRLLLGLPAHCASSQHENIAGD